MFRPVPQFVAAIVLVICSMTPASAQGTSAAPEPLLASAFARAHLQFPRGGPIPEPVFRGASAGTDLARPALLFPLYSTLAALQGADAYLTVKGLDAGVREQNPLMRGGRGLMTVTKVVTTATTIVIAERMWKRNRAAAIATMVAANAVTAVVVGRNARIVSDATR